MHYCLRCCDAVMRILYMYAGVAEPQGLPDVPGRLPVPARSSRGARRPRGGQQRPHLLLQQGRVLEHIAVFVAD